MTFTCTQCHRPIPANPVYCPHCGAFQKLNPIQSALRITHNAVVGGSAGVTAGIVGMVLLSLVLAMGSGFSQFRKRTFLLTQLGAICGGVVGATFMGMYEWTRRQ